MPTIGPASSSFVTNVCSAISISDAQATVQPAIDAVVGFDPDNQDPDGIFSCTIDAADNAVTVTVEPEDVAMANYESDVAAENVPANPLPGVGEVAGWTQVANNPPDVYAHKGHTTCEVKTGNTQVLSLTYDPTVSDSGVTAASAAAYATKLGALCTDVFAAIG